MSNKLVLVLNCGSSSLKFSIIEPITEKKYLFGIAEGFSISKSNIEWTINNIKKKIVFNNSLSHIKTIQFLIKNILEKNQSILNKIYAVGHRIVHGGEKFTQSVIIDNNVIKGIQNASIFAPLHNPAHLIGIHESMKNLPQLSKKHVAVFDTAFHQTMPKKSYLYGLPYKLYKQHGIRRYGAHGINHFYVMQQTSKFLNKSINELNIITCHLGNGSSIAAIRNGLCVDTSMGLTPLEGLIMGTRSGDLDPSIIFFLYKNLGMNIDNIYQLLNTESGLLGLTEYTNDCRYIEKNYEKKEKCKNAIDVFCHRLSKYIASYSILMHERLDAIIFTGGIGENSSMVRKLSVLKLKILGCELDLQKNNIMRFGKSGFINQDNKTPILVIPANEDLVIAQETKKLIS